LLVGGGWNTSSILQKDSAAASRPKRWWLARPIGQRSYRRNARPEPVIRTPSRFARYVAPHFRADCLRERSGGRRAHCFGTQYEPLACGCRARSTRVENVSVVPAVLDKDIREIVDDFVHRASRPNSEVGSLGMQPVENGSHTAD